MLSKAINTAGTAAMIEPTVGTKFSKPARMPHKIAKSRPRIHRPIPTKRPVTILEAVLTARYRLIERKKRRMRTCARRFVGKAALSLPGKVRASQRINMRANRTRSEEHTSELQSRGHLVCRLLLEKKKQ